MVDPRSWWTHRRTPLSQPGHPPLLAPPVAVTLAAATLAVLGVGLLAVVLTHMAPAPSTAAKGAIPEPDPEVQRTPHMVMVPTAGGHLGPIAALELSDDGEHVLTGGSFPELRMWDAHSRAQVLALAGMEHGAIVGVTFGAQGIHALTASGDLLTINQEEGKLRSRPSEHPQGFRLDANAARDLVTCGSDGVRVWPVASLAGDATPALILEESATVARFHPSRGELALGSHGAWSWIAEGKLTNLARHKNLSHCSDLAWSPLGDQVVTVSKRRQVTLHAWPSFEHRSQCPLDSSRPF